MKKKTRCRAALAFAACLLAAFAAMFAFACHQTGEGGGNGAEFVADIPADTSAEYGGSYSFETVAGLYNGSVIVEPSVSVSLNGESVQTENNAVPLNSLGEYIITYTFTLPDGTNKTFTQKVTCVDTKAPSIVQDGEISSKYRLNDTVELPSFTAIDLADGEVAATVTVYNGEETEENVVPVTETENAFEIENRNGYTIVATATDKSGNAAERRLTVNVFEENEIEFFNVQSYAESTVGTAGGGIVSYNTDSKYIFEGTGSMRFYTTKDGLWIMMRLSSTANMDFSDVYGVSFWVYNDSPRAYNVDFQSYVPDDSLPTKMIQRTLIPAGCWTKVFVPQAALLENYDPATDRLQFFFNGDDYKDSYWEFDMYFDCFKIETAAPAYSISPENITQEVSDSPVVLLGEGDYTGIDLAETSAVLTDENGNATELTAENGQFAAVLQEGIYTVNYLYKNGTDGAAASQTVTVYGEISMPPGVIDDLSNPSTAYLYSGAKTSAAEAPQIRYIAGTDEENPARIAAESVAGDSLFGLAFSAALFENVKTGDIVTVKYRVNISSPSQAIEGATSNGASDINLRCSYGHATGQYIDSGYFNSIPLGVWQTFSFTYDKAKAAEYGELVIDAEYPWAEGYYLTYGGASGSVEIASVTYESALAHMGFEETFDGTKYVLSSSQADTALAFVNAGNNNHSGAQVLRLTNGTWEGAGFVTVKLDQAVLNALSSKTKLVFFAKIQKIGSATSFALNAGTEESNTSTLLNGAALPDGKWVRYEITDAAAIEQIKAAGQIVLYISQENPEMIGFGFNAYFDDIAVVNK